MVGYISLQNCDFKVNIYKMICKTMWQIAVADFLVTLVGLFVAGIIPYSYSKFKKHGLEY